MQIHELNNFSGTLGSGAYLAVDDGNDTGKVSKTQLFAATEARIDNIIAGDAPSAAEVVDARLGADGVTYPSLGGAIRGQVSDLKSDLGGTTKNLFAFNNIVSYSHFAKSGETIVNTNTDSKTFFRMQISILDSSSTAITTSNYIDATEPKRLTRTLTPSSAGAYVLVKHNGSLRDLSFKFKCDTEANKAYTFSTLVTSSDPSSVGGLVLSEIQFEQSATATDYIPHMTATDYIARQALSALDSEYEANKTLVQNEIDGKANSLITRIDDSDYKKTYFASFVDGSPQNPLNDKLVTSDYIPMTNYEKIKVMICNRPNTGGCHYAFGFAIYNASKTLLTYTGNTSSDTNPEYLGASPTQTIAYVRVCVGEYDSNGVQQTLRATDFITETVYIASPITALLNRVRDKYAYLKSADYSADANFIFFTDVHAAKVNVSRIFDVSNYLGNIEAVINGGDTVNSVLGDMTWYNNLVDKCDTDVLICIGNHDAWEGTPGTAASKQSIYNAQIVPMLSKVSNIVQPSGAGTNYDCYYYKDYGNIRVIVLDAMEGDAGIAHYDTDQDTWLANVLSDAITNGKSVLAVNHTPFAQSDVTRNENLNWNSWKSYITADTMYISEGALNQIDTFISNGGNFVCWLTGHKHFDNVIFSDNHPNQFMLNAATANFYNHNIDGVNANDVFSELYDCMTTVNIDTTNKMVKFVRIGYTVDGGMKRREVMCYNYDTHKIISN